MLCCVLRAMVLPCVRVSVCTYCCMSTWKSRRDTLQCVHISEQNPAKQGEMKIFNQIMETFTVNELAALTQKVGQELGYAVEIKNIENPRVELEEHYYNPSYQGLIELGVAPHLLTKEVMTSMFDVVKHYKSNIRKDVIFRGVKW